MLLSVGLTSAALDVGAKAVPAPSLLSVAPRERDSAAEEPAGSTNEHGAGSADGQHRTRSSLTLLEHVFRASTSKDRLVVTVARLAVTDSRRTGGRVCAIRLGHAMPNSASGSDRWLTCTEAIGAGRSTNRLVSRPIGGRDVSRRRRRCLLRRRREVVRVQLSQPKFQSHPVVPAEVDVARVVRPCRAHLRKCLEGCASLMTGMNELGIG